MMLPMRVQSPVRCFRYSWAPGGSGKLSLGVLEVTKRNYNGLLTGRYTCGVTLKSKEH